MRWPLVFMVLLLAVAACGGCSRETDRQAADAKARKEQAPLEQATPDFDPIKLSILPQHTDNADTRLRMVKPGHWAEAMMATRANHFDFVGQISAAVTRTASGKQMDLDRTPFQLEIAGPAQLPKGQIRFLELPVFVPEQCERAWLAIQLHGHGGMEAAPEAEPLSLMKPYQFFMVVLAGEPDRYQGLATLDSVRAPQGGGGLNYYRVVAPPLKKPLALSSNSLMWSSIAFVVWDDVDPQLLSPQQQQALIDWLHQGGHLIVSGPKSLDQLGEKTFLHEYLPVRVGDPLHIDAHALEPINHRWTLPAKKDSERPVTPLSAWNGVTLQLQNDGQFVPGTGDLVAQRRVGRGRIVVTAFRLSERELWSWPGFDGFWNGCLLARPSRKFSAAEELGSLAVKWADAKQHSTDPQWVTNVRYLSRDWKNRTKDSSAAEIAEYDPANEAADEVPASSGIGGWTDFSEVADASRDVLKEAAGIVVPKSAFVLTAVALYLVVLVPLNWLVFWGIGRVEWAWIAAPIIALGSMAAVAKLAQLDIGFARSQTEVAVLEAHNNYARGLLTRYTALYTSLSTTYDVHAADSSTLILPFSADPNFVRLAGQSSNMVTYQDRPEVVLSGFTVSSNSTAMLHSEQMTDLGGAIDYVLPVPDDIGDGGTLSNHTKYPLEHAVVVRKTAQGQIELASVGVLQAGQEVKLKFEAGENTNPVDFKTSFDSGKPAGNAPRINISRVVDLALAKQHLPAGTVRLVGLIPQTIPGLQVEPAASQAPRGATIVVAELRESSLPEPRPDVNSRRDILTAREEQEQP